MWLWMSVHIFKRTLLECDVLRRFMFRWDAGKNAHHYWYPWCSVFVFCCRSVGPNRLNTLSSAHTHTGTQTHSTYRTSSRYQTSALPQSDSIYKVCESLIYILHTHMHWERDTRICIFHICAYICMHVCRFTILFLFQVTVAVRLSLQRFV